MHRRWSAAVTAALLIAAALILFEAYNLRSAPAPLPAPESRAASIETRTIPFTPPPVDEVAKAAYVGNTNTHKLHRLSCRYAGCKNCTARFATRDEALQAGYRPGGCCDP
jgi:hypothetical protein